MNSLKGVTAEGGFAETVLVYGNNISGTVAFAESYLINFDCNFIVMGFFGQLSVIAVFIVCNKLLRRY